MTADRATPHPDDFLRGTSLDDSGMAELAQRVPKEIREKVLARAWVDEAARSDDPPGSVTVPSWTSLWTHGAHIPSARGRAQAWRGVRLSAQARLAICTAILVLSFVFLPSGGVLTGSWALAFVDLMPAVAAFCGAGLCLAAARHPGDDIGPREAHLSRVTWALLACAAASWGIGELAWTAYEMADVIVPLPSWADAGYLMSPFLLGSALLLYPAASPRHATGRLRVLLDGLVITAALFGMIWIVSVNSILLHSEVSWLGRLFSVAYPVTDVLNLAIAFTSILHVRRLNRAPYMLITLAILFLLCADLSFLYLTEHDAYRSGSFIDLGWIIGFLLLGHAALARRRFTPMTQETPTATFVRLVLPLMALGCFIVALTWGGVTHQRMDTSVAVMTGIVVTLTVVRQVSLAVENARLGRQLTDAVRSLAQDVAALRISAEEARSNLADREPDRDAESLVDSVDMQSFLMTERVRELSDAADRLKDMRGR